LTGAPATSARRSSSQTALVSVYASIACGPIDRPHPDCLYPPHGAAASGIGGMFTNTAPALIPSASGWEVAMSLVRTEAASP